MLLIVIIALGVTAHLGLQHKTQVSPGISYFQAFVRQDTSKPLFVFVFFCFYNFVFFHTSGKKIYFFLWFIYHRLIYIPFYF